VRESCGTIQIKEEATRVFGKERWLGGKEVFMGNARKSRCAEFEHEAREEVIRS